MIYGCHICDIYSRYDNDITGACATLQYREKIKKEVKCRKNMGVPLANF